MSGPLRDVVLASIADRRIRRTIRGMLYRALKRGEVVALRDVARRVVARYSAHVDESSAARIVREVAHDYAARSRLSRR
jgi:hypothetical protein